MEHLDIPWDQVDWLFVGGSTAWKCDGAFTLIRAARDHGKKIHIGRINSLARFRMFASVADTCDGTILAFGPNIHAPRIRAWASEAIHDHLPMETA
jgi:hypothetical protein